MSIYKSAIEKPVTTALIFVAVIVIGVFSLSRLPIDQFPEMDPPFITVMTTYPGASASEIETNVTKANASQRFFSVLVPAYLLAIVVTSSGFIFALLSYQIL